MDEDGGNGNGHEHTHTVERIVIEFDPNTGQLHYRFDGADYASAIGRLELAQMYMFHDMQQAVKAGMKDAD